MKKFDIYSIEEEIKKMHFEAEGEPQRRELLQHFWKHHVVPVVEYSKEMSKRYGGENDVIHLGALLHDMALLHNAEPHDEIGAEKAYEFLIVRWVPVETARKVKDIVLKHRCKLYEPQTLEEKIVATADALAHFFPDFHGSGALEISPEDHIEMKVLNIEKLEREYERKVFFENEKEIFKQVIKDFQKQFYN